MGLRRERGIARNKERERKYKKFLPPKKLECYINGSTRIAVIRIDLDRRACCVVGISVLGKKDRRNIYQKYGCAEVLVPLPLSLSLPARARLSM